MELNSQNNISWTTIIGRLFIFFITFYWTYRLLSSTNPWIFLDNVNLLIHESGHLLFAFAGELIGFLGGTIAQLIIPLLFGAYFIYNQKYFESFFCLFWLGDNLVNISIYIKDAQVRSLYLVGGGIHDWYTILNQLHILSSSYLIGSIVFYFGMLSLLSGILLMFVSIYLMISIKLNRY
jgi:hypothetical protein